MSGGMFGEGVPPRRAAALVICDLSRGGSILLGRRNPALPFMGGHHAFLGGSLVPDDAEVPVVNGGPDPFLAGAVRETFEETGMLLVDGPMPGPVALAEARDALNRGELRFSAWLREAGCRVDAAAFTPAGRWITPSFSPIRYDTQYFLCRRAGCPPAFSGGPDDEICGLDWLTPEAALARWRAGGIRLSTPVAYVLRSLAALPPEAALERLRRPPGVDDVRADYIEPRPGIHMIPLRTQTLPPATHTNCVVVGWRELIIVDPGPVAGEERARLTARLDDLCALGGAVAGVALTHAHGDHAGAAAFLAARHNVPVWAHPAAGFPGARPLEDGAVLTAAGDPPWRLRALHTPGHDPGHLAFLEETTRTLLSGDLFANPGTILVSPEHGGDMTRYLESLERAAALEGLEMVVPSHGWAMPGAEGIVHLRRLIAHRLQREARIRAALDRGLRAEDDLLDAAYDDTPADLRDLARLQLRAHLRRLGRS